MNKTIFNSLLPVSYYIRGVEDGCEFPFIQNHFGIASIEEVKALLSACESHLSRFSQTDIDGIMSDWRAEREKAIQAEIAQQKTDADTRRKESRFGFVYVMKNRRNGYLKIGFSACPSFREKTLQSEEPDIHLLKCWKASMKDEESLHAQYAANRVRGEWFALAESVLSEIDTFFFPGAG